MNINIYLSKSTTGHRADAAHALSLGDYEGAVDALWAAHEASSAKADREHYRAVCERITPPWGWT